MALTNAQVRNLLEDKYNEINKANFIVDDPISVPKAYGKIQDIEITAFWTSMLAWGQRKTIINKSLELFELMDNDPHTFICQHEEKDRKRFANFKHRTFQYTDTLYFLEFLQWYYRKHASMEDFFIQYDDTASALEAFHDLFFSLPDAPSRTRKHVATPARKSSCKRLNMFLRWMVRKDAAGVDFGIWQRMSPSKLMIPLDVHVGRVARKLGLLKRKQRDWLAVEELTKRLRRFDSEDPVKYDYALYGMGVLGQL